MRASLLFISYSWGGGVFLLDGFTSEFLLFLTLFTFWFVYFTEVSFMVRYLCSCLVLLSFVFFRLFSLFFMFLLLEVSLIPLLFLVLGFGSQREKVQASYYLVLFSVITSSLFLFFYVSYFFVDLLPRFT